MLGTEIVAKTLVELGVKDVFGIVGIPVIELAMMLQEQGIRFWSFRNEQAMS